MCVNGSGGSPKWVWEGCCHKARLACFKGSFRDEKPVIGNHFQKVIGPLLLTVWSESNTPWEVVIKAASRTCWTQKCISARSSGDVAHEHVKVWDALLWRVPWLTFWRDGLLGLCLFWPNNWPWVLPVPSQHQSLYKLPRRFLWKHLPFKRGLFREISRV